MFDTRFHAVSYFASIYVSVYARWIFHVSRNLSVIFVNYRTIKRADEIQIFFTSLPRKQSLVGEILRKELLFDTVIKWWANFSKCMRDMLLSSLVNEEKCNITASFRVALRRALSLVDKFFKLPSWRIALGRRAETREKRLKRKHIFSRPFRRGFLCCRCSRRRHATTSVHV